MKVYYMKEKALDSLQKDVEANLEKYQSGTRWIDQYFIEKETPKYYFDTGIEVPDYELIIGGPETDFQNAKILFEAFKEKLNPVQASDLRLWAYEMLLSYVLIERFRTHPLGERWCHEISIIEKREPQG